MGEMVAIDFDHCFVELTGHPPLAWQRRLYRDHFHQGDLPEVIDLPTGVGKTMVMAIWLIALAKTRFPAARPRTTFDLSYQLPNSCRGRLVDERI